MARFYETVVQAVLLYGSETWVLSEEMVRLLNSFHNRCARHLTQRHIRQEQDGSWTTPPSTEVLEEAGLKPIQDYIQKRKQNLMIYATRRPIYEECKTSPRLATNVNQLVWWTV